MLLWISGGVCGIGEASFVFFSITKIAWITQFSWITQKHIFLEYILFITSTPFCYAAITNTRELTAENRNRTKNKQNLYCDMSKTPGSAYKSKPLYAFVFLSGLWEWMTNDTEGSTSRSPQAVRKIWFIPVISLCHFPPHLFKFTTKSISFPVFSSVCVCILPVLIYIPG